MVVCDLLAYDRDEYEQSQSDCGNSPQNHQVKVTRTT
jgi:hypothetical protein